MHAIAIISDTHLGSPRARLRSAADLAPLWEGCAELIVNGDVAELHHPRWRARAARDVLRLQERCAEDGVRLTLLSGNHDAMLTDERSRLLAGGEVLVMHGDAVHPALTPWSPSAARMRRAYAAARAAIPPEERGELRAVLDACQHVAHQEWLDKRLHPDERGFVRKLLGMTARPWLAWQVLVSWRTYPRLTAAFAAEHAPQARFVVIGHLHRPSVAVVGSRTVINTGSFELPGPPRLVRVEDGRLSVHGMKRRRSGWVPNPASIASFPLGQEERHRPAAVSHRADDARPGKPAA